MVADMKKNFILGLIISILFIFLHLSPVAAQAPVALPTTPQISCPVVGGKILTSSYQQDPANGHCGTTYGFSCQCTNGRRAKAIDIPTNPDTDVVLPTIGGANLTWRLAETLCAGGGSYPNCSDSNGGTGGMLTFVGTDAASPADKWYMQFVHMKISTVTAKKGETYQPGTAIGKTDESAHVHAVIGKNLNVTGDEISGSAACDDNWLPSDFICDPTKQPPVVANASTGKSSGQVQSNYACTKVGTPTEEMPAICKNQPANGTPGNFVHYCQGDSRWQGQACDMGQVGCGPTSAAMITTFFGQTQTPDQVFKTFLNSGALTCSAGINPDRVLSWFKENDYEVGPNVVGGSEMDAVAAKTYIDKGYIIMGSSHHFRGQTGSVFSHVFVVQDVDPATNTFIMRDPENCSYGPGTELTQNNIQPIISSKIPDWAYAYPIKRKGTPAYSATGPAAGGNVQ